MHLCDRDIEIWLKEGKISIIPYPPVDNINGATVDIRLGNKFRTFAGYNEPFIDLNDKENKITEVLDQVMSDEIELEDGKSFYLHPGELVLAVTFESITLPSNLIGWLNGRSSLARLGLLIHMTAHRIDPGWSGNIVLEFFNAGKLPLALYYGMKIGAISFELLTKPAARTYNCRQNAKYCNQQDITIK